MKRTSPKAEEVIEAIDFSKRVEETVKSLEKEILEKESEKIRLKSHWGVNSPISRNVTAQRKGEADLFQTLDARDRFRRVCSIESSFDETRLKGRDLQDWNEGGGAKTLSPLSQLLWKIFESKFVETNPLPTGKDSTADREEQIAQSFSFNGRVVLPFTEFQIRTGNVDEDGLPLPMTRKRKKQLFTALLPLRAWSGIATVGDEKGIDFSLLSSREKDPNYIAISFTPEMIRLGFLNGILTKYPNWFFKVGKSPNDFRFNQFLHDLIHRNVEEILKNEGRIYRRREDVINIGLPYFPTIATLGKSKKWLEVFGTDVDNFIETRHSERVTIHSTTEDKTPIDWEGKGAKQYRGARILQTMICFTVNAEEIREDVESLPDKNLKQKRYRTKMLKLLDALVQKQRNEGLFQKRISSQ